RYPPPLPGGDNPRSEQPRALPRARWFFFPPGRVRAGPGQRQNLHRRIVVIEHLALRRLTDRLVEGRLDHRRRFRHDLPLRRRWQRNPQTRLQPRQPVERNATAILQQPDHRRRALVVLLLPHALRRGGLKNLPAQITAQALQLVNGGRQRRLAHHPNSQGRLLAYVNLPLQTFRTVIPWLQGSVRDFDALGTW